MDSAFEDALARRQGVPGPQPERENTAAGTRQTPPRPLAAHPARPSLPSIAIRQNALNGGWLASGLPSKMCRVAARASTVGAIGD